MKFCPTCGHTNDQTALYCEACGIVLDTNPSFSNVTERGGSHDLPGITPPPPPPYMPQEGIPNSTNSAASGYYTQPISTAYTPHQENTLGAQQSYWKEEVAVLQRPARTTGRIIINSILYLWGVFCSAFGASGLLLQNASSSLIGVVFLGYGFVGVILLVPIIIVHKRLLLRTRMRTLCIVGATVAAGVLCLISAGILSGPQHGNALNIFLGAIFIVYGIVVSILAVL